MSINLGLTSDQEFCCIVGQILETHLGWACSELGIKIKNLVNKMGKKILMTLSKFTEYLLQAKKL